MDDNTQLWLEFANADLETASFLYDKQYPRQLEIICYEKARMTALQHIKSLPESPLCAFHSLNLTEADASVH